MKKKKKMGLFTEGTIIIHALSEEKRQKESFLITVLTGLFICCGMTLLVFGNLWDICLIWKLEWKNVWNIFLILMSVGAVLLARLLKQHRFIHLVSAAVLLLVGIAWRNELLNGCYYAANAFLFSWNQYYGMQLPMFKVVVGSGWEIAILYLAAWMNLCLSYLHGKRASRLGTVLLSLLPIALGLLVGTEPNYRAFLCILIGSILLFSGMGSRKIKSNRTAMSIIGKNHLLTGGIFLIVLIVYINAGTSVEGLLSEHHEQVLAYQKNVEKQLQNVSQQVAPILQDGVISNQKVVYTGKEIFRVTVEKKPDSILYFRGFVGDTYKGGIWLPIDENAFQKDMDLWTPTPEKGAGSFFLNYSYELQSRVDGISSPMLIVYTNTAGNYAYIPYYANIRNPDIMKKLYVEADSIIYRRKSSDSVQFNIVSSQNKIMKNTDFVSSEKDRENYTYYALKHYIQTPSAGIARLAGLANSWRTEGNGAADGIKGGDTAYDTPIAKVREELCQNTDYSRNLDAVPAGEDVVENFLFDSKKGYCIHYASAATLLLRYLGVPARYVEGYAVEPQDFKENDNGTYTAIVPDYDGHAWAEVYKKLRGWVPVEVTKGTPGSGYEDKDSNKNAATMANEQAKKANANHTVPDTAQAKQTTPESQKKHTTGRVVFDWKQILGVAIVLLILVTAVAGMGYLIWIKTSHLRKMIYLRRHFLSHDTRKAVLAFSYAIHQQFLRAGIVKEKHMWDDDYVKILQEKLIFLNQDELCSFLDCAKKTAFSPYQPTEEEVEEGRVVYQKIVQAIHDGMISK